nr:MAG TPA: hypothetical protein [Caudoviricetes sp.]
MPFLRVVYQNAVAAAETSPHFFAVRLTQTLRAS